MDMGAQISGASPTLVPKNSSGATPTMLKTVDPEFEFAVEKSGSLAKAVFPEGMADDGYGVIAFGGVVGVGERAANLRRDAEMGNRCPRPVHVHDLGVCAWPELLTTKPWTSSVMLKTAATSENTAFCCCNWR